MTKFILLVRQEDSGDYNLIEGEAQTEYDFLRGIEDHILEENDWVVYEVVRGTHKDEYVHSGGIDEVVEEY